MKIIEYLQNKINEKKELEELNEKYQSYLDVVKKIRENQENFIMINLDMIKDIQPSLFTEEEIKQLEWIQLILKGNQEQNLGFELVEEQENLVNEFMKKTSSFLEEKINNKSQVVETEKLIHIIQDPNKIIGKMDLEHLFNLLDESKLSTDQQLDLLTEVLKKNREAFYQQFNPTNIEEEEELKETNLDYELVKNKLEEYGIDCEQISTFESTVLKYGILENITDILDLLKENKLLDKIDYTTKAFAHILTFSNKNLVEKQIVYSRKYIVDFNDLLCHVSNFIPNSKSEEEEHYTRRMSISSSKKVTSTSQNKTKKKKVIGTAKDFETNVEYLEKLGLDISKIMKNTLSVLSVRNKILKINIETLILYGFDILDDDFSLSVLSGSLYLVPRIDTSIELGIYDYIKRKSSLLVGYTDRLLHNIYYQNKNNMELFSNHGLKYELRKEDIEPRYEKDRIIDLEKKYQEMSDIASYYECIKNSSILDIKNVNSNPLLSYLEQFTLEENDLIYKIDGIMISRLKVLRIYNQIIKDPNLDLVNGLLFAMTYNSLLSEEDYETLKGYVNEWHNDIEERIRENGIPKKI